MAEYEWIALYSDETYLPQKRDDGTENGYLDIDRDKLVSFQLHKDGELVYWLFLEPGQKLIYRIRHQMVNSEESTKVFMIGWQQNVNGKNVQSIAWIMPDGKVINTGRFREDHVLFSSPEFKEVERTDI